MGLAKLCKNYCINRATGDDGLCDVCREVAAQVLAREAATRQARRSFRGRQRSRGY